MSKGWKVLATFAVLLAVGVFVSDGCARTSQPEAERRAPREAGRSFEYALSLNPYELSRPELRNALDLAQEAGVNSIGSGAIWWYVAPRGSLESDRLKRLDLLVNESRKRGLKVSLQVSGTPDWVHPGLEDTVPEPSERIWHPPRGGEEIQNFDRFVRFLVDRYGTRVERYEIWNEPNSVDFWKPRPDPDEYAALLRRVYLGAKRVDPRVTIAFGGLSMNDTGYLTRYYEAVRSFPDAPENDFFFDVLSAHPYTYGQSPDWVSPEPMAGGANGGLNPSFWGITDMKYVMEQNDDAGKGIFIGEFGYSTEKTEDTWMNAVPDHRRAFYLTRAYSIARELPYVSGLSWYAYVPGSTVGEEWTIVDANLEPSLTYRALKQTTGAGSQGARVTVPEARETVFGTHLLRPAITGGDETDLRGWELFVDGELAGSYGRAPLAWDTRRVGDGVHSLVLAAYTRDGHVWSSTPVSLTVRNGPDPRA